MEWLSILQASPVNLVAEKVSMKAEKKLTNSSSEGSPFGSNLSPAV